MEFNISPEITDKLNAFWNNPYAIAATYVFWAGAVALIALMVIRYKMPLLNAILVIVGVKRIPKKDGWFDLLGGVLAIALMILMAMSWHTVNS